MTGIEQQIKLIYDKKEAYANGVLSSQTRLANIEGDYYNAGIQHGRLDTLVSLKEKLHGIAATSILNEHEVKYENYILMLSEVDKAIDEMLEESNYETNS